MEICLRSVGLNQINGFTSDLGGLLFVCLANMFDKSIQGDIVYSNSQKYLK